MRTQPAAFYRRLVLSTCSFLFCYDFQMQLLGFVATFCFPGLIKNCPMFLCDFCVARVSSQAHRCMLETAAAPPHLPWCVPVLGKAGPNLPPSPAGFQSSTRRPQPALEWNVSIFLSLFAEGL